MNLNEIEIKMDLPYPEIEDAVNDNTIVAILKNLATSKYGELNGVLQYVYQSVMANKTNKEIADLFEEIAIVEMMHLDLLMKAITEFGGVPRYEDANGNSFTSNNINYTPKLKEMLEYNIKSEQTAIEMYTQAKNRVTNISLKNLLERIIMDEHLHLNTFKNLLNNITFMSI